MSARVLARRRPSVIPGLGPSLGFTLLYVTAIVMVPLGALVLRAAGLGLREVWETVAEPRVLASLKLSFGMALAAAAANTVLGPVVAWVLVRYRFPGRAVLDALVDLPFALPTAVAGITLTTLFAANGWLGRPLHTLGIDVAFTRLGIAVGLVFIGLPFVVRTVQPVLEDLPRELEEAAASLGAGRGQTLMRVVLPELLPAMLTGAALAFARGAGEYGSIVFISGNMPMRTEIAPLLIVTKLEQYDYAGATAIATVMLVISFAALLVINRLQRWTGRKVAR